MCVCSKLSIMIRSSCKTVSEKNYILFRFILQCLNKICDWSHENILMQFCVVLKIQVVSEISSFRTESPIACYQCHKTTPPRAWIAHTRWRNWISTIPTLHHAGALPYSVCQNTFFTDINYKFTTTNFHFQSLPLALQKRTQ